MYPMVSIGTFQRKYDELLNLFSKYPYDRLWIDTAYRYGNENMVSKALKDSNLASSKVIYTGKICYSQQVRNKTVKEELQGTLRRLKISEIDIYLIHSPRYVNYCETWREMQKLRDEGLIKNIGVSNFGVCDLKKIYHETGEYPQINQIVCNPNKGDDLQNELLISFCKSKSIVIQAAMPFGGALNAKRLTLEQRKNILQRNCKNQIVSVIGTGSVEHMIQNLSYILGE